MIYRNALVLAAFVTVVPALAETVTYQTSLASPGFYNGTGISNSDFTVATSGNIELGLSAVRRYFGPGNAGGVIDPGAGSSTYYAPVGAIGGLALWNVEFSINTQFGGGSALLSGYQLVGQFTDLTTGTSGPVIPLIGGDDSYWNGALTSSSTGAWGAQNSENPTYGPGVLFGETFNPYATHDYLVSLTALNAAGNTVLATDSINIQATAPEPGTLGLTGLALAVAGFFIVRKRRQLQSA